LTVSSFGYLGSQGRGKRNYTSQYEGKSIMKNIGITARRKVAGAVIGSLLGGVAAATIAAPSAVAVPQGCNAADVAGTASSTLGAARGYLNDHPGANQAVTAAFTQPRGQASADLRNYFTANPGEYYDLKGILAPIGDKQRQCNVPVLPADLQSAYDEFMAG
jgi:hemophore-related protein